jgi:hypothetical protein
MQSLLTYTLVAITACWQSTSGCPDSMAEEPSKNAANEANGITVGDLGRKGIIVGSVTDMGAAGKMVREALKAGNVDRFTMGEISNANMEFFKELDACHTVNSVTITNVAANKIDVTSVSRLFPCAASVWIYLGGNFDADFSGLQECRELTLEGTISPRTLESLLSLKRLEFASFFVDERTHYADVEKLAQMKNLEVVDIYPAEGFKIPKEWVEKLNGNATLRKIIDPVRSGWIRDSE